MSNLFLFVFSGSSNSVKLIRFFKVVSLLGGMVWFSRFLIAIAIISGVLFLMR